MAVGSVPGAVVGFVQSGKLAWSKSFGVTDLVGKNPVTADTIFQAASLSKQVTAHAAYALRDQGKLDFTKTLVSYVDDLADAKAKRVTIAHVLSHSSGFPNWRDEAGQNLIPAFEPGERFQYSGEGYVYLQRIIEQVTGKGFGEAIDQLVLQPLGMNSTAMMWMPEFEGRYAEPHSRRGEARSNWQGRAKFYHTQAQKLGRSVKSLRYADSQAITKEAGNPPLPNWMVPNAAASMVTCASDYAKFLAAAAMKNAELRKPLVEMRAGKDWMLGWGPGWGVERVNNREYLWQWGDNGGYKNIVFVEPARGGRCLCLRTAIAEQRSTTAS